MATRSGDIRGGVIAAPSEDLCLGFVNTRSWRGMATPSEELHGLDDVLAWSAGSGGVDAAIVDGFRVWWRTRPGEAAEAFADTIELREMLFRMFGAVAGGQPADPANLAALNAAFASAAVRARMALRDGALVWSVDGLRPEARALLSPVLWSAADLLAGARRGRVRQCDNPQCRWVFIDDSKSGNRRWCSMASCGNRAKAHRHYLKRRETGR
ncbi:MAG: CGNR zinc finger domain-containing protein [Alphaproteobacteria bacterium]|nr:CGNR zinc finger domain-containing protein [Alphaproteobacteria bacterium]